MQNQASDCQILVVFGKFEVKLLVYFLNLQTCRQNVVVLAGLLGNVGGVVVLVLNVAEDFLNQILERDDARCAAKFINNHGDALLVFDEEFQKGTWLDATALIGSECTINQLYRDGTVPRETLDKIVERLSR